MVTPSHKASLFVCISGASAGIGLSCAEELAKMGHHLILGARRIDRLEEAKKKLLSAGAKSVLIHALDVEDLKSVEKFSAAALNFCNGQLDVLINNAGLALGSDHLKDGNLEQWETVINVNVTGVLRLTRT